MKHAREDYNRFQDPEGRIPEHEPVFLLRGQDASAPDTVRHWAQLHHLRGGDPILAQAALGQARAMDAWQAMHGAKIADSSEMAQVREQANRPVVTENIRRAPRQDPGPASHLEFENWHHQNFYLGLGQPNYTRRASTGAYLDPAVEREWQTWQGSRNPTVLFLQRTEDAHPAHWSAQAYEKDQRATGAALTGIQSAD